MEVYRATAQQLIGQVVEGYNGTIFAYVQRSGRTYTMMGMSELIAKKCYAL